MLIKKVKTGKEMTLAFYQLDTTAIRLFPKGKIRETLSQL
jgi:hypothetical protein